MTTSSAAGKGSVRQACDAASWLSLAAAPSFALMALVNAGDVSMGGICVSRAGLLPVDGMTAMYLLMSFFHLPPWLRLARRRP